jgi:hypothetical protein
VRIIKQAVKTAALNLRGILWRYRVPPNLIDLVAHLEEWDGCPVALWSICQELLAIASKPEYAEIAGCVRCAVRIITPALTDYENDEKRLCADCADSARSAG